MDSLTLIQSLDEAIRIISNARIEGCLASGSSAIWRMSDHASNHLDKQIADLLKAPAAELPAAPAANFVRFERPFRSGIYTGFTPSEIRAKQKEMGNKL